MKRGKLQDHCGNCNLIDYCTEPYEMPHLCVYEELEDADEETRIRFYVGDLNDEEINLVNYQKAVLSVMKNNGFGIRVTEDMYFSMPCLLRDDDFPIEVYQKNTDTLICFSTWKELEEYSNKIS